MRKIATLAFAAVFIVGCASQGPLRPDGLSVTPADAGPAPPNARTVIDGYLRNMLKDPYSAQVENVTGPAFLTVKGGIFGAETYGWGVCFEVNARNSFGAYVGFRPMALIWRQGTIVRTYGEMTRNIFDQGLAQAACNRIRENLLTSPGGVPGWPAPPANLFEGQPQPTRVELPTPGAPTVDRSTGSGNCRWVTASKWSCD